MPICRSITSFLALMFCAAIELFAQGFDWQYSSRLPTSYPEVFIGVFGSGMWTRNQATMRYTEIIDGKVCDCGAEFKNTDNFDGAVGIAGEYWFPETNIALYSILQGEQRNATFRAQGRELPVNPRLYPMNTSFTSTYTLQTQVINATLEAGAKVKFAPLPLFVMLGLQGSTVVFQNLNLREEAPSFLYRADNLPTNFITFQPILVSGKVAMGADIALTKSIYAAPAVFASLPLGSIVSGENSWTRFSFGVQLSLMYGFLP